MSEPRGLLNDLDFELLPAPLARGRRAQVQRRLANAHWLARRKRDGRFLAVVDKHGRVSPLLPLANAVLARIRARLATTHTHAEPLPLGGLHRLLQSLGVDPGYAERHQLAPVAEPYTLTYAGRDRYRRPLWLMPGAARAWLHMQHAAAAHDVAIDAISGFRSHAYQAGIVRRKLACGLDIGAILAVNAAPGYSEHHSGRALDLGYPGQPPAVTEFEQTAAFSWLCDHAARFGFHLSYPRDNPHGIVYEPWHWAWRG